MPSVNDMKSGVDFYSFCHFVRSDIKRYWHWMGRMKWVNNRSDGSTDMVLAGASTDA